MKPRIVVVGGVHTSGKTVLRRVCNSHPEMAFTEEFNSFLKLGSTYRRHVSCLRKTLCRQTVLGTGKDPATLGQRLRCLLFLLRYTLVLWSHRHSPITAEAVSSVYKRIFPNAKVVGDVGPRYRVTPVMDTPNIAMVYLYRDCRDVVAAFQRKFKYQLSRADLPNWLERRRNPRDLASIWAEHMEEMLRAAREHAGNKVYLLRYESLAADTENVLGELGRWLCVDPKAFCFQWVHPGHIGDYKRHLSHDQVAAVEAIAGPAMRTLGYLDA